MFCREGEPSEAWEGKGRDLKWQWRGRSGVWPSTWGSQDRSPNPRLDRCSYPGERLLCRPLLMQKLSAEWGQVCTLSKRDPGASHWWQEKGRRGTLCPGTTCLPVCPEEAWSTLIVNTAFIHCEEQLYTYLAEERGLCEDLDLRFALWGLPWWAHTLPVSSERPGCSVGILPVLTIRRTLCIMVQSTLLLAYVVDDCTSITCPMPFLESFRR